MIYNFYIAAMYFHIIYVFIFKKIYTYLNERY